MTTHLYVSPHLDDAAFSCPGRILRDVDAGHRVVAATVFSEPSTTRREEDIRALTAVGCGWHHLGLTDAIPRLHRDYSLAGIMGILGRDDDPLSIDTLCNALSPLVEGLNPSRIYWPLGVGQHIDHLWCFAASRQLVRAFPAAEHCYYEERPYAFSPTLLRWRRRLLTGGGLCDTRGLPEELRNHQCGALLRQPRRPSPALRNSRENDISSYLSAQLPLLEEIGAAGEFELKRDAIVLETYRSPLEGLLNAYPSQLRWLSDSTDASAWMPHCTLEGSGGDYGYVEFDVRIEAP